MSARPTDMIHSQYFSKIDPDLCTGCEACMDRCPMDAIKPSDGVCEMIDGRCIGCGVCVPTCPVQAIALQEKPGMEEPPLNLAETFRKMKAERELP